MIFNPAIDASPPNSKGALVVIRFAKPRITIIVLRNYAKTMQTHTVGLQSDR